VGWRGPDFWRKPLILLGKLALDGRECGQSVASGVSDSDNPYYGIFAVCSLRVGAASPLLYDNLPITLFPHESEGLARLAR